MSNEVQLATINAHLFNVAVDEYSRAAHLVTERQRCGRIGCYVAPPGAERKAVALVQWYDQSGTWVAQFHNNLPYGSVVLQAITLMLIQLQQTGPPAPEEHKTQ